MVHRTIGREVVRGTISRDHWRATVVVACSDRIPAGRRSPFYVSVRWRASDGGTGAPGRPEDARPVVLALRKRSDAASGDIRFDRPDGPTSRELTSDTEQLLALYGVSATVGEQPDVMLDVQIEGETRDSVPLSVGDVPAVVAIRASDGVGAAPDLVPPDTDVRYAAVVHPPAEGAFDWFTLGQRALPVVGASDERVVAVRGSDAGGVDRAVLVHFQPQAAGQPAVMAAHRVAVAADAIIDDPAALVPSALGRVVAAGWSRGSAHAGEVVQLVAILSGGVAGQRVTFDISAVTAAGSMFLERVDAPLADASVMRVDWRVPEAIPGEDVPALGFGVALMDEPFAAADADDVPGHPDLHLYARLDLLVTLRMRLADSTGRALSGLDWELRDLDGTAVEHGRTAADGEISVANLSSRPYILVVDGVTVLDAEEQAATPPVPSTAHTVFSFVDMRDPGRGEDDHAAPSR